MSDVPKYGSEQRVSVSLIKQGRHRLVAFSISSDTLAKCCYATTREEDTKSGFQRVLDEKRARAIADYIDSGLGTIPSSIVLSAQPESKFNVVDRGKTASFIFDPHSFLIIDGQHRVFGFAMANTELRVPVVVYQNLTRTEEAKLFIDVNTKQKPVPKELLLAIKSLALSDTDQEALLGEVFDLYDQDEGSALIGLTSSTRANKSKISRVTFNAGFKTLLPYFKEQTNIEVYKVTNAYFHAVLSGLRQKKTERSIANKTVFRAFAALFPEAASKVQDRFGRHYKTDHFASVLEPVFMIKKATFQSPSVNYQTLLGEFQKAIKSHFLI